MSDTAFPSVTSLPGRSVRVTKTPISNTLVQTVQAGTEIRLRRWAGTKYRYTISFSFLRKSGAGGADEVAALRAHIEQHKGSFDSFPFTDPEDGVVRRVRYADDEIEFEQIVQGVWSVSEIELITTVLDFGTNPAQPGDFAFHF